jgi:tRNA A-37 threonylcarbamoyl transferase component Bud32
MPSLYLKNNYTSTTPKPLQSRQSSVERGVTSMSKDVNNSNGRIVPAPSNASFLLAHQLGVNNAAIQDRPPSSSTKRIAKPAIIKNAQAAVFKPGNDQGQRETQSRMIAQSANTSTNTSVDKLKKTFFIAQKQPEDPMMAKDKNSKVNQSSTHYTADHETTILWKEDLKLNVEDELTFTSCLGQGSFAKVYEGYDKRNKMNVAIKVIDKRKVLEPKRRALIQTEINILSKMKHRNIGEYYRLIEDHKRLFIVMQLCGSLTLNHFCRQFNGKRLNEEQSYAVFSQIAKGVKYMHEHNVAHRDLKLTNILIDEEYTVKIIDFGFACEANERHKMYCGTPSYMAPEIVEKKLYFPKPTDIWSLGVVLYKLLTGDYIFGGKT